MLQIRLIFTVHNHVSKSSGYISKWHLYSVTYNEQSCIICLIRWDKDASEPAHDYTFLCCNGNANHHLEAAFFLHTEMKSPVKRAKFITDSCTLHQILLGW